MEPGVHPFPELFKQFGLDSDPAAIDAFFPDISIHSNDSSSTF